MNEQELLRHVDHTCLSVTATWTEIQTLCDDGMAFHTASVCIPPAFVKQAADYVQGKLPICTVVGFPNGYATTAVKALEARDAIANGAAEIDMVLPVGQVKAGEWAFVQAELAALRTACAGQILKVIVEACLLTEPEKMMLCRMVTDAGADYIKTSTGFSTGGATKEDVLLFREKIGKNVRIKAAGGIRTVSAGLEYLALGADRIGSSGIVLQCKERDRQ